MLDDPEEVEAVCERVQAVDVEVEEREGRGFLGRDPWEIAEAGRAFEYVWVEVTGTCPPTTPSGSLLV